jgi:hypothetical protein
MDIWNTTWQRNLGIRWIYGVKYHGDGYMEYSTTNYSDGYIKFMCKLWRTMWIILCLILEISQYQSVSIWSKQYWITKLSVIWGVRVSNYTLYHSIPK